MKIAKLALLGAAALVAGACDDDGSSTAGPPGPQAYVRFVHGTPDMGTVDFRFVDRLENLPTTLGVTFRNSSGLHQAVAPGTRPFRIFRNSSDPEIAKTRLVDSTITLEAGKYYLLLYTGTAANNQDGLVVIEENIPSNIPAGQIAVKAVHAVQGAPAADVAAISGSDATEFATGLGYLGVSAYQNIPALDAGLYTFDFREAGTANTLVSATPNEPGAAPSGSVSAQAGVRIPGSALTAVALPGAVPGSPAETASNTTPTVLLLLDNIPVPQS